MVRFNTDKWLREKIKEERQERIYEQILIKRKIRQANVRIRELKKAGLVDDSIAVENVMNYLGSKAVDVKETKAGYISVRGISGKSMTQMTAINKSLNEFIKNKTSTVSGMKELYEQRREELGKFTDNDDFAKSLSYSDIKDIYSVFKSNEYNRLKSVMDSKTFFTLYTQAMGEGWNKERFMKEINMYIDSGNDLELKESITNIYNDYVSNYT